MSSILTFSALAALATVATIPGCSAAADDNSLPLVVEVPVSVTQLPFTRLLSAPTSGFTEPAQLVIRDLNALNATWIVLHQGVALTPVPPVDLSQKMVVVLALGPRNVGGYAIHFDSITVQANLATVHYTVNTPGLDCISAPVLASPVDVVVVPRFDLVGFDAITLLQQC
jgi:hypothetical protein